MAHFRVLSERELDTRLTCLELAQWIAWHAVEQDAILRAREAKQVWVDPFSSLDMGL